MAAEAADGLPFRLVRPESLGLEDLGSYLAELFPFYRASQICALADLVCIKKESDLDVRSNVNW